MPRGVDETKGDNIRARGQLKQWHGVVTIRVFAQLHNVAEHKLFPFTTKFEQLGGEINIERPRERCWLYETRDMSTPARDVTPRPPRPDTVSMQPPSRRVSYELGATLKCPNQPEMSCMSALAVVFPLWTAFRRPNCEAFWRPSCSHLV